MYEFTVFLPKMGRMRTYSTHNLPCSWSLSLFCQFGLSFLLSLSLPLYISKVSYFPLSFAPLVSLSYSLSTSLRLLSFIFISLSLFLFHNLCFGSPPLILQKVKLTFLLGGAFLPPSGTRREGSKATASTTTTTWQRKFYYYLSVTGTYPR